MQSLSATLISAVGAFKQPGPLTWPEVARSMKLNIKAATLVGLSGSSDVIRGAKLSDSGPSFDGVLTQSPKREILLLFPNGAIIDPDIDARIFGTDQTINPSKLDSGYAISFRLEGCCCSLLVSKPDSSVEGIMIRSS